jgi:hypothetical protein
MSAMSRDDGDRRWGVPLPPVSPNFTHGHPMSPNDLSDTRVEQPPSAVQIPSAFLSGLRVKALAFRCRRCRAMTSISAIRGARRLRVVTPKTQNPAQKPGRRKCIVRRSRPRLCRSANKIRKHLNRVSVDSKKIFQYHGWLVQTNRSVQADPFFPADRRPKKRLSGVRELLTLGWSATLCAILR